MKTLQLMCWIVGLICSAACARDAPSIAGTSNAPVVAETATGLRAMQPVGLDSGDLPEVARVFGVLVNGSDDARNMRVWLWRSGHPEERIDVTGEITPAGNRHRIAFKDVSTDETFQSWAKGDGRNPAMNVILHRHDNGFAIDVASDQAMTSHLVIGYGAPGSRLYAARFGKR